MKARIQSRQTVLRLTKRTLKVKWGVFILDTEWHCNAQECVKNYKCTEVKSENSTHARFPHQGEQGDHITLYSASLLYFYRNVILFLCFITIQFVACVQFKPETVPNS